MKKISRRKFLGTSAFASGSMLIPRFLKAFENNHGNLINNGKVLVILQLSGGNDGLNTVVPYRNDTYYKSRPNIAVKTGKALRISDDLGFNPIMSSMQKLFDQGWLSIINSVGYPNPDLSHFRSMDIWHTASDSNRFFTFGWIGRYLDNSCPDCNSLNAVEVDDTLSLVMKGERVNGLAVKDPYRLFQSTKDKYFSSVQGRKTDNDNLNFLYKVKAETISSANYIYAKSKIYKSTESYPQSEFGKNLKTIAELIISGSKTSVYYVSLT